MVVPPIVDVVADQETLVVLFNAVAVDRIVKEERKIRPELQPIPTRPALSRKGLVRVCVIVDRAEILPFGFAAFAWIEGAESADFTAANGTGRDLSGCVPGGFEKSPQEVQIRVGG